MKRDATELLFCDLRRLWLDCDKPEIRNQLAAAPQFTGNGNPAQRRPQLLQLGNSLIEDGLREVHAKPAFAFARDSGSLLDPALERAAQSLGRGNATLSARGGEILEVFHTKQLMQLEDGGGPQARDRVQFEQPRRELLAHPLKRLIILSPVQRLDAFGKGRSDAGNGLERPFADQLVQRPYQHSVAALQMVLPLAPFITSSASSIRPSMVGSFCRWPTWRAAKWLNIAEA
jgi:hypothetical protein